jgi:hypothetical protein
MFLWADQPLQQAEVLFIAVGSAIEIAGNAHELFLFNRLFGLLHKGLIGSPGDPCSLDCVRFRSCRNLIGMEVMEAKAAYARPGRNVNAPPPKGGGFELRLKAGLVRLRRTQVALKSSSGSGGIWFSMYSAQLPRLYASTLSAYTKQEGNA